MIVGGLSTFVISVIAPSHRCIAYAHTVWHEATKFDTLTHLREKKLLGVGCAAQPRAPEDRFFKILLLCMLMLFNRVHILLPTFVNRKVADKMSSSVNRG